MFSNQSMLEFRDHIYLYISYGIVKHITKARMHRNSLCSVESSFDMKFTDFYKKKSLSVLLTQHQILDKQKNK